MMLSIMASQIYDFRRLARGVLFLLLGPEQYYANNSDKEKPLIYDLMRYVGSMIGIPLLSFVIISMVASFLSELRQSWLKTRFGGDFMAKSNRYSSALIRLLAAAFLSAMVLKLRARLFRFIGPEDAAARGLERAMRSDMLEAILGCFCTWFAAVVTKAIEQNVFRFALHRAACKLVPGQETPEGHYQYKQLGGRNIRLLKVGRIKLWGRKNNFRLTTVSLDDLPRYNTLSYTWDSQPQDHFLDIDGQTLPITENVAIIIGTLSSFWTSKLIWIDQICINQQDPEEKTAQVQLMSEVYGKATSVIVWLSPLKSNDMAQSPPEWLMCNIRSESSMYKQESQNSDPLTNRGDSEHPALHPSKDSVLLVLSHRFWRRLWIVQEIAFAQDLTIIFIDRQINWTQLCMFVRKNETPSYETLMYPTENNNHPRSYGVTPNQPLSVRSLQGIRQIAMLADIREMIQHGGVSQDRTLVKRLSTLWDLLSKTASSSCSDERDKLFGLFGLLETISRKKRMNHIATQQEHYKDNEVHQSFRPDYSKSAHEVFSEVARACIERNEGVDPLRWAGSGWYRNIKSLPKWVTDWSLIPDTLIHGFEAYPGYYQVGGLHHSPELAYSIVGPLVRVHGALDIGRIITLTSIVNHDHSLFNKRSSFIREWLHEAVEMMADAPQSFHKSHGLYRIDCFESKCKCRDEVLWRTLVADMYVSVADKFNVYLDARLYGHRIDTQTLEKVLSKPLNERLFVNRQRPAPRNLEESFAAWSTLPDNCQKAEASGKAVLPEVIAHATRFSLASRPHTQGRRLALTEYGHLCLVPPLAQIGDIVCAFENIRIPYLIRERKKNTIQYLQPEELVFELVGQCYAHGIMAGERSIYKSSIWEQKRPIFLV